MANSWSKTLKFQIATVYWDIFRGHNRHIWRVLLLTSFGIGVLI